MCLDTVIRKLKRPSRGKVQEGWKTFDFITGKKGVKDLQFEFFPLEGKYKVPIGKWLKATVNTVTYCVDKSSGGYSTYASGFHIYTEKPAKIGRAVKVKYRGAQVFGRQDGLKVVVAREMYVPRKKDRYNG